MEEQISENQVQEPQIEQQAEQTQEPPQAEKKNDTPEWVPKRMGELAAARRAAEQRAESERLEKERLMAELAQLRAGGEVQQPVANTTDVHALAQTLAEQMVNQRRAQEQLAQKVSAIEAAGKKEFGDDFEKAISTLQMAGVGGNDFLRVLANVPNAEKVVTWLGNPNNVEEAIRISSLDPVAMGIEMTKLAGKAAKELGKQISKAPAPMSTVEGGSSSSAGAEPDPKKDAKAWIAWRNQNARRK